MDQLITVVLNLLKFTIINDDISDSGCKSKNNNEVDISVKTILNIIVKKKNVLDLKIIEWTIHKNYFKLFVLDNFEDKIYLDSVTVRMLL